MTAHDLKVGKQVVDGDRALVSITGTSCSGPDDTCHTITDANSGMPSPTLSFDAAFTAASNSSQMLAASTMVRVNGTWYVQLSG